VVRASLYDGSTGDESAHMRPLVVADRGGERYVPMMRDQAQGAAVHLIYRGIIRITQARCGLDQRIEYFLHVEGRPADDL